MNYNKDNKEYSISLYADAPASDKTIENCILALTVAFPAQADTAQAKAEFFSLLTSRIKENNISDQRLRDAVKYVIDNHKYKTITIADILQQDKKLRLYTYQDYLRAEEHIRPDFKSYRKINGTFFYYRKSELALTRI